MIGVFDSGLGGLTVLKNLLEKFPENDFMYLGDNARAPYGDKSHEEIYKYTKEAVDFLFGKKCELIIVACNTASSKALRKIQQEYLPENYPDKKVLGVLIPAAEFACEQVGDTGKRVGVIATNATIESGAYPSEIKKINPNIELHTVPTPLLVSIVESENENKKETEKVLQEYLQPLIDKKIDSLILGCTHYPFLQKEIEKVLGGKIKVISTPVAVAEKLETYFKKHNNLYKNLKQNKKRLFFTTDNEKKFKQLGEKFLKERIKNIQKVKI